MLRTDDRNYHQARARDELDRALEATDPAIARVHRELAALHRRRMMESVNGAELQLQPVPPEFKLSQDIGR